MPNQFANPANPRVHRETTAEEIWRDTEGQADILVSGVGTGGTLPVWPRSSKPENRPLKSSPWNRPIHRFCPAAQKGPHKIQGIGAGFIPEVLEQSLIDDVVTVSNDDAFETARSAAKLEGILCGISSGAAIWAALEVAKRPEFRRQNHRSHHPQYRGAVH